MKGLENPGCIEWPFISGWYRWVEKHWERPNLVAGADGEGVFCACDGVLRGWSCGDGRWYGWEGMVGGGGCCGGHEFVEGEGVSKVVGSAQSIPLSVGASWPKMW